MNELCEQFGSSNVLFVIFGIIVLLFLILDLGIFVLRKQEMTLRNALIQTVCWLSIALLYGTLLYFYHGEEQGLQYISAYLMEYSLSADNLFVFIIILSYFNVTRKYYHKVLFYGIIGAVIFRVIFILLGIVIVEEFHWMLYIFGGILVYTGASMLFSGEGNKFNPEKNIFYKFFRRYFSLINEEADGNFFVRRNGKRYLTILFLVITILASTDLVFALDSIPAVFAISQDRLVIISSNVFAVMGLRAMFYLLSHAASKFDYLQEGISIVLIFIGAKMIIEIFGVHIATEWSLAVIVGVISIAIVISILVDKKKSKV